MKTFAWIVVFLALGCQKKSSDISIDPAQFVGTWKSSSTSGLLPYQWTFDSKYLYLSNTITSECQPVQTQPWEYRVEKNVLIAHYVGSTAGSAPLPDSHFTIISLTGHSMIVQVPGYPQEEFDRCQ